MSLTGLVQAFKGGDLQVQEPQVVWGLELLNMAIHCSKV